MRAGRDDLAGQALARRTAMLAQVSRLREQQATLRAEEQAMTGAARRLQDKIDAFGAQKEAIKAAYTVARARAGIAEVFAGISADVADADVAARRAADHEADLQARTAGLDDRAGAQFPGGNPDVLFYVSFGVGLFPGESAQRRTVLGY